MTGTRHRLAARIAALALVAGLNSCGSDTPNDNGAVTGTVINVPLDEPTIADAVTAAKPGDLILIAAGTYEESVNVATPNVVIRGVDRNTVVLDGGDRLTNGLNVTADGVAIENLTVHHYTQNGIIFTGLGDDTSIDYGSEADALQGYRVSYVTAYNNGLYGIYAFAARNGLIEHSLVSGHPDSGLYVGQCRPCNVVITDAVAERNAIGYYGTNASGGVYVVNSTFTRNRLGITPNSQQMEKLSPQVETFVVGNRVIDNDDPATPIIPLGFFGGGIAIGGGNKNTVSRNLVTGNDAYGIGVVGVAEFDPSNNRIAENVVTGNGIDLLYMPTLAPTDPLGNCFIANTFNSSAPESIESALPCTTTAAPLNAPVRVAFPPAPEGVDYRAIPPPRPQPGMPDSTIPAAPAADPFVAPDLATIGVPTP